MFTLGVQQMLEVLICKYKRIHKWGFKLCAMSTEHWIGEIATVYLEYHHQPMKISVLLHVGCSIA